MVVNIGNGHTTGWRDPGRALWVVGWVFISVGQGASGVAGDAKQEEQWGR